MWKRCRFSTLCASSRIFQLTQFLLIWIQNDDGLRLLRLLDDFHFLHAVLFAMKRWKYADFPFSCDFHTNKIEFVIYKSIVREDYGNNWKHSTMFSMLLYVETSKVPVDVSIVIQIGYFWLIGATAKIMTFFIKMMKLYDQYNQNLNFNSVSQKIKIFERNPMFDHNVFQLQ